MPPLWQAIMSSDLSDLSPDAASTEGFAKVRLNIYNVDQGNYVKVNYDIPLSEASLTKTLRELKQEIIRRLVAQGHVSATSPPADLYLIRETPILGTEYFETSFGPNNLTLREAGIADGIEIHAIPLSQPFTDDYLNINILSDARPDESLNFAIHWPPLNEPTTGTQGLGTKLRDYIGQIRDWYVRNTRMPMDSVVDVDLNGVSYDISALRNEPLVALPAKNGDTLTLVIHRK